MPHCALVHGGPCNNNAAPRIEPGRALSCTAHYAVDYVGVEYRLSLIERCVRLSLD
jgi:hypothetical protein